MKEKILIIIMLLFSIYTIGFVINKDVGKKYNEVKKIPLLEEKIVKYQSNEKEYKQTLKKIAENIYRTDSFLRIGGDSEKLDYDKKDEMTRILEGRSDFDDYLNNVNNFFDERKTYFNHIPNIFPVRFSKYNRITSEFGDRISPISGVLKSHKGIDIASTYHAKILATADGVVEDNWIFHPEFGRMIIIDHGNGYKTVYAHLFKSYVHEGYKVKRGDVIGLMGQSGEAFGQHLHYEVRKDGKAVDPMNFLRGYIDKK